MAPSRRAVRAGLEEAQAEAERVEQGVLAPISQVEAAGVMAGMRAGPEARSSVMGLPCRLAEPEAPEVVLPPHN